MQDENKNWWTRECGGREVLNIALPLVISTGFFSLTLFVDRMFLLWYSPDAMAAAMPAGMMHWTMVCFPLGIVTYTNTFVAQYHGAGRPERIGAVTWQAARIAIYGMPLFLCGILLAPYLFHLEGHDSIVRHNEILYFQTLTFGSGAVLLCGALSSFFTGRGETRVVMYVNMAAMFINIGLDYVWIFGELGFSAMGIEGAGWATIVSHWFKVVVYLMLMFRKEIAATYKLWEMRRFDGWLFRRLFLYGAPSGLQYLIEGGAFTLIIMKMREAGDDAMAATTLAFSLNAVAFIPMLGLGIAVSTLVGQQLTGGRAELAARATWTSVVLALIYTSFFGVIYVLTPDLLLAAYALGGEQTEFAHLRETTIVLLRFVAAYCLFDALQIVFVGAIKGAGDTWFVLGNAVVVSSVFLSIGWIGGERGGGLYFWWSLITAWIVALGVIYFLRFLQGRWRTMRVIEHDFHGSGADDSLPREISPEGDAA